MTDLHTAPTNESAWDKRKSQIQNRYEQTRYA